MAEKPTAITADVISQTAIRALWTDSVDGTAYLVYAGLTEEFSAASLVGAADAGIEEFVVSGLVAGTNYFLWVVAIAADGSQSDPEGPASATTMALLPPADHFFVQPRSSSSVEVQWLDVAGAELYKIYVNDTDVFPEASLAALVVQGHGFGIVAGLVPTSTYYFWVVAEAGQLTGTPTEPFQAIMPADVGSSLDIPGIKTGIWFWATGVVAAAGLSDLVIWANQNGTRPQTEHVQLNLAGPMMIGAFDSITPVAGQDQVFSQRGLRSFLVSVNVYSPEDAVSLAARLQSALSNPVLKAPLVDARLGVGKISDVRDLSAFLETEWEQRAQFDFTIFSAMREEIVQDLIETVQIQHVT